MRRRRMARLTALRRRDRPQSGKTVPDTFYGSSAALEAQGDRDGAIAEIREAIQLNPDEPAYRTQLSALLKSQRESPLPTPKSHPK